MLLVDYREGSAELVQPLTRIGLPVEETDLSFGEPGPVADIAFAGRGEGGAPVDIGIEFKKLGELVQAFRTERLQGAQMLSMRQHYDFSYLLFEGELLYDPSGMLLRRTGRHTCRPLQGGMSIGELHKRLMVLHLRGGLNPWHTTTRAHTVKWIEALYRCWTDQDLDQHRSHLGMYQPPTPEPVSEFRQWVIKRFPGIGFVGSKAVEERFGGSYRKACNASLADWAGIELADKNGRVRKIGASRAEEILHIIEGKTS